MSRRPIAVAALAAAATVAFTSPPVPASELLVPAVEVADAALVAEAGDSAYVAPGEHAVFLGTAFGGSGDYTFAWSSDHEAVSFEDPANPTGVVDTAGLAPDIYEVTLAVGDGADTATDTVAFVVAGGEGVGETEVLLEETVEDLEPGVFAANAERLFPFAVPEGLAQVDAVIEWSVPTNDYDLQLVAPDGRHVATSGGAPPATREATGVSDPDQGEWKVRVERWATVAEPELTVTVTGTTAAGAGTDPRPALSTTGPYDFVVGQPQDVTATVDGGTDPVVGWDTDLDGLPDDASGPTATLDLPIGRHLVTAVVTDAAGFERREMTTVTVGADEAHLRELAVPFTVIAVADTGINPYHAEFSAATYPDPEVLEVTRNFTRHPSEYIPGYPQDAQALPATTGQGYYPARDGYLWSVSDDGAGGFAGDYVDTGRLYWVPGTKIIGAVDSGGSTGATSGSDGHPILDDHGHGSGSGSVSTGNRYGYCPTCLLVMVEALDESVAAGYPWVDISSNSFGAIGGIPIGAAVGADEPTRTAAERGQLTFFSAGNGTGNAFATTPILTHGSSPNGADWVISVGATREDNQGAIISDGFPVHVSALGDGDLPSACRTGDTGQCAFGGTSAASPYTAGAFGRILTEVRDAIGDGRAGQKTVEFDDGSTLAQVVAVGRTIEGSDFLDDGILTRAELRAVGLKTALPRGQGTGPDTTYPFPWTWEGDQSVWFEGYGSAGPTHAERAIAVLLGEADLPNRDEEDAFFAMDCDVRDGRYGSYDRDGDGEADPCSEAGVARYVGDGPTDNVDPTQDDFDPVRDAVGGGAVLGPADETTYFLHREPRHEPDRAPAPVSEDPAATGDPGDVFETDVCAENDNEQFMSTEDTDGDVDVCFDNRITSVPAAFRPKGIFTATDQLAGALPAGSTVTGTIHMQSSEATVADLELVLKATDREVGRSAAVAQPVHPGGWTQFDLELTTDRLVAAGEQLTVNLVHAGVRSWAYGYTGDHASSITITPAGAPAAGNEFGVEIDEVVADGAGLTANGRVAFPDLGPDPQLAGFHAQSQLVQVSVGDASFADSTYAAVDRDAGTWSALLPPAEAGEELFVRALRDRVPSGVTGAIVPPDDSTPGRGKGKPDDPGNGRGRGNGDGPPEDRGKPDVTGNDTAAGTDSGTAADDRGEAEESSADVAAGRAVPASPVAAPARGSAVALWLLTAGALALTLHTRRRLVRG